MSICLKIHLAGDRAEDRGEKKSNEDRQNDDDDHLQHLYGDEKDRRSYDPGQSAPDESQPKFAG
jgi:hypothetical protein